MPERRCVDANPNIFAPTDLPSARGVARTYCGPCPDLNGDCPIEAFRHHADRIVQAGIWWVQGRPIWNLLAEQPTTFTRSA